MRTRLLVSARTVLRVFLPASLLILMANGCKATPPPAEPSPGDPAAAHEVGAVVARQRAMDTIVRLFNETDAKNWVAVKALFADSVDFDMTSIAGGEPTKMTPEQIAGGWSEGLSAIDQVHHQAGNFLVTIDGDVATVTCYGIATHYRKEAEKKVTTFVGSYEFRLERAGDAWKIHAFKFNLKYMD